MGFAILSGCSLNGGDSSHSLYVDLSALRGGGSRFALLSSGGATLGLVTPPPTTPDGFACYAVNVTGPGIGDLSGDSHDDPAVIFPPLLAEQSYCSYRGIVTPPLYLSGGSASATLQVPPGGVRLVQVVGINDSLVCASGVVDDPSGTTNGGGRFFEVGRAVLGDVFEDRSVDVAMNWPATTADQAARLMDCGGGNCGTYGGFLAGSPVAMPFDGSTVFDVAQRVPPGVGKYIRSVDLDLGNSGAVLATISVRLYESLSGNGPPGVGGSSPYTAYLGLNPGAAGTYTFDLSVSGSYLQMQSGKDYWIVVSSDLNDGTVSWKGASGTGAEAYSSSDGTTWSLLSTFQGMNYRVVECGP
jgi:hypothetical protein